MDRAGTSRTGRKIDAHVALGPRAVRPLFYRRASHFQLQSVEQRSINADQKSVNEDQRRVIEDQIRANNEPRAEKEMEYASKVTWWLGGTEPLPT